MSEKSVGNPMQNTKDVCAPEITLTPRPLFMLLTFTRRRIIQVVRASLPVQAAAPEHLTSHAVEFPFTIDFWMMTFRRHNRSSSTAKVTRLMRNRRPNHDFSTAGR